MGITLRPHQISAVTGIEASWVKGNTNVIDVLPTGAGKTILKAEMARRETLKGGLTVIFAHRDVLLEQISKALCLMSLPHSLMVSQSSKRNIGDMQTIEFGKSFINDKARIIVASVDKFYRANLDLLAPHVTLWMLDECHHLLDDSKWHRCIDPLINARGLGVTATPRRADKKGLGRKFDGLFDDLIISANMGDLIEQGMLSPYRVYTPPSLLNTEGLRTTASGDYNNKDLAKRTDKAAITGDAVEHYLKLAPGKRAICFCVNIDHSDHVAAEFRKSGIRAVSVSSKTPAAQRNKMINDFKNGAVDILVNCDLFGEGFDVPAVECVIMLRKTASFSLYKQQFGRALRCFEGKEYGILIDHVGNVDHFCYELNLMYPHDDPEWSLSPPERKRHSSGELVDQKVSKRCRNCNARYYPSAENNHSCPYCNYTPSADEDSEDLLKFKAEKGELVELKIEFVERILNERKKVDLPVELFKNKMNGAPPVVKYSAINNHVNRQNAQIVLRDTIQKWCSQYWRVTGARRDVVQAEFESRFGINILKAQVLSAREAEQLTNKIKGS